MRQSSWNAHRRSLALLMVACMCSRAGGLGAQTTQLPDQLRSQVYHWAPFVVGETLRFLQCPRTTLEIEHMLKVDFDNDVDASNNDSDAVNVTCGGAPDNMDRTATVYFSAVETGFGPGQGYYYLSYYWYHIRDNGWWAGSANNDPGHEHDMEGVLLAVKKNAYTPYGDLAAVLTEVHGATLPWHASSAVAGIPKVRDGGAVNTWPEYRVSGMNRPVLVVASGDHATYSPQVCDAGMPQPDNGFGIWTASSYYTACIHEWRHWIMYQPALEDGSTPPDHLGTSTDSGFATYQLIEMYQSPLWTYRNTVEHIFFGPAGYYSACGGIVLGPSSSGTLSGGVAALNSFYSCSGGANPPWFWQGAQNCYAGLCYYEFSEDGTNNFSGEVGYPTSSWYGGFVSAPDSEINLRFSGMSDLGVPMRYNPYILSPPNYYTPVLTTGISGPNTLTSGDFATWTAVVSGGAAPYTYRWSGIASGTSSSISAQPYSSGDLYLDVWDASGQHAMASIYITVNQCDPRVPC